MIKKIVEILIGAAITAVALGIMYGAFLLNTYRWGDCS